MCGIAGGVALDPRARPDVERVRRMSALVSHRGPDGEGLWTSPSGRACLAHRRLAIIDLATGQQPMFGADGGSAMVFNGEIYNYVELRDALARRGETFRTTSDTEVLLRLLDQDGPAAVGACRGMFAFAWWNDRDGRLLLARDRVGKKPLYYVVEDGVLYFASALRALRGAGGHGWPIDDAALDDFLTLGYIPAPRTIYRDVHKLEAATYLLGGPDGVETRSYWDLAPEPAPFEGSYEDAVDQLDERIGTAVRIRLRSDVPLGIFLSGGIDSSLVAAVAARQAGTRVLTFSIGFEEDAFDESPFSSEVAQRLGTEHRLFHAKVDVLDVLPQLVQHCGEPFGDSSALPVWMLARETRRHVTVGLGGDGGDEGFAGYRWYRTAARIAGLSRMIRPTPARVAGRALATVSGGLPRQAGQVARGLGMLGIAEPARRFAALRSFVNDDEIRALYGPALLQARAQGGAPARLAALYQACAGGPLRRMRYVDVRTYLADCLMPKVDVATMAHGLEARAPLLDHEVLEFAMRLPEEWMIGPDGGKRILRAVLARYLPRALFDRPKQGFSLPLPAWFAGVLRPRLDGLARSERLLDGGRLSATGVETLVEQHARGWRDHSQRLFNLLVLDEWLKAA